MVLAQVEMIGNDSNISRSIIVGAVLFHNGATGEMAYGAGYQEVWNAVTYNTNYNRSDMGAHGFDTTSRDHRIFNSIDTLQGTSIAKTFYYSNSNIAQPEKQYTPTVYNNCFSPRSADTEALGTDDGTGWPGTGTYASPPAWIGPTNLVGLINCKPNFVNLNLTVYANNDFHLQSNSSAIETGRFLMLANGSGIHSNIINVTNNGGGNDPRWYFISPDSLS